MMMLSLLPIQALHPQGRRRRRLAVIPIILVALSFINLQENNRRNQASVTDSYKHHNKFVWEPPPRRLDSLRDAFPNDVSNITTYQDLHGLVNFDIPMPHDLNIVFMGDSLTRYQYLDLAFFLSRNGTWDREDHDEHFEIRDGKMSWNTFFTLTNEMLSPFENLCDCSRFGKNKDTARENRYFYEPQNNNRLTYLLKFGHRPFRSSWDVSYINEHSDSLVNDPQNVDIAQTLNWTEAIEDFVCKMMPRPAFFVFNSGLWADDELVEVDVQTKIVQSLSNCNIISVYKTTTIPMIDEPKNHNRDEMCQLADICYNVSWTGLVTPDKHADNVHFTPPIYSMLNIHLLSMLASGEVLAVNS
mmetsp:Transcript_17222/g.34321  ORF Transcript_17222/g.34321 Transcript_17222/m.34321 type:complete len:358 (+) Transcript_17222:104-1177(+)